MSSAVPNNDSRTPKERGEELLKEANATFPAHISPLGELALDESKSAETRDRAGKALVAEVRESQRQHAQMVAQIDTMDLVAVISSDNDFLRDQAICELQQRNATEAIPELAQIVAQRKPSYDFALEALGAFGKTANPAVEIIAEVLTSGTEEFICTYRAAKALFRMETPEATKALCECIENARGEVRQAIGTGMKLSDIQHSHPDTPQLVKALQRSQERQGFDEQIDTAIGFLRALPEKR